ncbi:unnamed protein product [Phaedon cochleariae]|uniref:Fatty acyl-CoA reductase n=1 Tax=Phaedon cochleariae TaxID=80249 RepID=A0A9N9SI48_PHACE|nr:unnamed protein product [Phaedon cochleariae]
MKVTEYFVGKNVFVTGGTGFLGKVLIEKLLRSCDGIDKIYVLMRPKRGKSIEERLEHITTFPLFDKIRQKDPGLFTKLVPINGDITELKLGMSEEDRQLIIDKVHIVYHTAASVKFDDPLKYALIVNVRGTRELVQLASELKNLSVLVHVSTAYCNCDKPVVEEILYPAPVGWQDAIRMTEEIDDAFIKTFSEKYISPLPNTYTFAKALAEHVVTDMCKGKLPAVIVRPSVVVSTIEEPMSGWIDNFNGPVGLLVAGGKGILRTVLGDVETCQDYIPVDIVVNIMIVATKTKGSNGNTEDVEVYNASKENKNPVSMGELIEMGAQLIWDSPFSEILWYPRFKMTKCWYNYYIQVILFHMLPAFFIDLLLRIIGRQPMLFSTQRKVYIANVVVEPFLTNSWTFKHTKTMQILDEIEEDEKTKFGVTKRFYDMGGTTFEYFRDSKICAATFILKEEFDFTRTTSLRNLKRLWIIDVVVKTIFLSILMWFVFVKLDILRVLYLSFENYIINL